VRAVIKKVEVLANLAVIITSTVLCSVLIKKYFYNPKPTVVAAAASTSSANTGKLGQLQPGTKISLPGIEWRKNFRTVVLALSTTCHFCSESGPFYQQLEQQRPGTVGLVAVLPQSVEDGRNYLEQLGVKTANVIQSPLSSIGVSGTPTLMLVDQDGSLIASWVGKLPDSEVRNVMSQISQ
jgi:hypothetical protein